MSDKCCLTKYHWCKQSTGRGQGNQQYNLLLDQEDAPPQSTAKGSHRHRDAGNLKRQRPDTTGDTRVLAGLVEVVAHTDVLCKPVTCYEPVQLHKSNANCSIVCLPADCCHHNVAWIASLVLMGCSDIDVKKK